MKKFINLLFMFLCLASITVRANTVTLHNVEPESKTFAKNVAVIIKDDGIYAVDIENTNKNIQLNSSKTLDRPLISLDNQWVAYCDYNGILFVSSLDFSNEVNTIKISDRVVSYIWNNHGELVFSRLTGGIETFNVSKGTKENIIYPTEEYYSNLILNGGNKLFAQKYLRYNDRNFVYDRPLGIVQYDLDINDEKIVVPYEPAKEQDDTLGLNPSIAGISYDGSKLFIWCRPNSASLTADGVKLGYYNIENSKFNIINNPDINTLTYKDNISPCPNSSVFIALINGEGRWMNENKTLGILDIVRGIFKPLTDKEYTAMTPNYSLDGKKIIYSQGKVSGNGEEWFKSGNKIYEVDIKGGVKKQLTKENDGFDFYPEYINNKGEFVFLKWKNNNDISLLKVNDKEEEFLICDKVLYKEDYFYYGHYDVNRVMDIGIIK